MFVIVDDILVVGYDVDGKYHDNTLLRVIQTCKQENLKLNKGKCLFRCTSGPFLVKSYPVMV